MPQTHAVFGEFYIICNNARIIADDVKLRIIYLMARAAMIVYTFIRAC